MSRSTAAAPSDLAAVAGSGAGHRRLGEQGRDRRDEERYGQRAPIGGAENRGAPRRAVIGYANVVGADAAREHVVLESTELRFLRLAIDDEGTRALAPPQQEKHAAARRRREGDAG